MNHELLRIMARERERELMEAFGRCDVQRPTCRGGPAWPEQMIRRLLATLSIFKAMAGRLRRRQGFTDSAGWPES